MYLHTLEIRNVRTFDQTTVELVHPDMKRGRADLPRPSLPNVNLLLGDNGAGKSTLLKAVALAGLGPAVGDSGLHPYRLIRRERVSGEKSQPVAEGGSIDGRFVAHLQDGVPMDQALVSEVKITARGEEVERLEWAGGREGPWEAIYNSSNGAFFVVGYGATRRVETRENYDPGARLRTTFSRALRIHSLFEEAFSLIPLSSWLPERRASEPERFQEVKTLLNALLTHGGYRFPGRMQGKEYVFSKGSMDIPFPALSDGYRAYLGWVGDLLYHLCQTCPAGMKLVDSRGIVMVDEVDLHLHPKWQMTLLSRLGKTLPHLQFLVTSHSPLLVGSLEWMNILHMTVGPRHSSKAERIDTPVHGLDADQILLTDFFGLQSTRAASKEWELRRLMERASEGDTEAAKSILDAMSQGSEAAG